MVSLSESVLLLAQYPIHSLCMEKEKLPAARHQSWSHCCRTGPCLWPAIQTASKAEGMPQPGSALQKHLMSKVQHIILTGYHAVYRANLRENWTTWEWGAWSVLNKYEKVNGERGKGECQGELMSTFPHGLWQQRLQCWMSIVGELMREFSEVLAQCQKTLSSQRQ